MKLIPIKDLKFADYNPRKISKENFERLRRSIKEFGFTVPNTVNSHNGRENVLIGGHMRTRAAEAEGMTEVPCWIIDVDPQKERMLNVALNNPHLAGDWDDQMLAEMLVKLNDEGADVKLTGFDEDQVTRILDDYMDIGGGDAPPEPPKGEPESKVGEIYELGPHRLMCADCTDIGNVSRLMGDKKANLVFTDPPYGVDYDGGATTPREKLLNDDGDGSIYARFLAVCTSYIDDNAALYIWFAGVRCLETAGALTDAGWTIRSLLIWNKLKAHFGALGAQYKHRYEPFFYCHKRGHSPRWYGPSNEVSVWDQAQPSNNEHHPTEKPLQLAVRAILNSSIRGDIVMDVFGGSGTTLIASERTGRVCYMMELDPRYCDVIRKRYAAYVEKGTK